MIVISNTTPFISLCSVDLLHLLPSIFGEVLVAPSVADECSEGGRIFVPDLTSLPWVKVQPVENEKQGLIPSFSQAASQMREQGIYFHEGLVNRIATRLGEVN